ncbi:MAG: hypothetical protein G3M70_07200 [Candidatus Nitronauta litoralis]|uniref:Glycoside-hydrolase family GH114 TIM-barrel domain-containing protein n=1 Tax=Candidatus Nitronauta litoralis TaxID=2705533 RepID=A0A7T0G093_9BACT|nr:MAG: hypothetical protein G3M70_07200 [Candidatus Nitronauta litoralis]
MIYQPTSTLPANLSGQQLAGPFNLMGSILNAAENTPSNITFVGERCNLVLASDPDPTIISGLKTANPNCIVLWFVSPYFATGDDLWNASTQELQDALVAKYGLHDPQDQPITYGGPTYPGLALGQALPLMDVRNAAWQDYFAAQMAKYVPIVGFDGVFLDTMTEDIPAWALAAGPTFPKGYTANGWKYGSYEFLAKIQDAMAAIGKVVYFNGISKGSTATTSFLNKGMLEMVEGGAVEAYSIGSDFYSTDTLKQHFFQETVMRDLSQALLLNKKIVIEAYVDTWSVKKSLYFLGGISLVQNGNLFPYLTENGSAGTFVYLDEWGMNLGDPVGAFTINGDGTYQRQFTNGLVVVNPTANTITRQVALAPFSGNFFLNS